MAAVRLTPLTVKVAAVPAVPKRVVPRASVWLLTVIDGVEGWLTVPLTLMSCSGAPVLSAAIIPLSAPSSAVEVMRARIVVEPTTPPVSGRVTVLL